MKGRGVSFHHRLTPSCAVSVDVAEIATWVEPVAQAAFESLGVWKPAIGLALPNRLAVIGDFEDPAGSRRERHLAELGPDVESSFCASQAARSSQRHWVQ